MQLALFLRADAMPWVEPYLAALDPALPQPPVPQTRSACKRSKPTSVDEAQASGTGSSEANYASATARAAELLLRAPSNVLHAVTQAHPVVRGSASLDEKLAALPSSCYPAAIASCITQQQDALTPFDVDLSRVANHVAMQAASALPQVPAAQRVCVADRCERADDHACFVRKLALATQLHSLRGALVSVTAHGALSCLTSLQQLRRLEIENAQFNPAAVAELVPQLPQLNSLCLSTRLSAGSLAAIATALSGSTVLTHWTSAATRSQSVEVQHSRARYSSSAGCPSCASATMRPTARA